MPGVRLVAFLRQQVVFVSGLLGPVVPLPFKELLHRGEVIIKSIHLDVAKTKKKKERKGKERKTSSL